MIRAPALPPNFTISEEANRRIRDWIQGLSERDQRSFMPAIFMGDVSTSTETQPHVPVIGAYPSSDVDENDVFEIDGLRFVFPVLEQEYDRFEGKILDIQDNRYVLI